MKRDELGDLAAFLAVAEHRSFTRAAARLGTSQSALSHTVRRLEERLDVRLLTRTTRNVSPTEAGERLAAALRPAFDEIRAGVDEAAQSGDRPVGTVRITSSRLAARTLLWPASHALMQRHPGLNFEINCDSRFTDIVAERYDAGVRLGESLEKDMIAVRIGPEMEMAVVGAPSYFARRPPPLEPQDLQDHECINLRMPTLGGLYAWEFEKDGRALNVRVEGRFTANEPELLVDAALAGAGLCCLPDHCVTRELADGRLIRALADWTPPFPGAHLYYPSRRQMTPGLRALIDELRGRARAGT